MTTAPITFLIIDDDEVDYLAIKRALKLLNVNNPSLRAKNGVEGLELLHDGHNVTDLAKSCIILLDLNMPKMSGIEFLVKLRDHPKTKAIPVYITTTSNSDQDIIRAYRYNISQYIVKSDLFDSLREALEPLEYSRTITGGPRGEYDDVPITA